MHRLRLVSQVLLVLVISSLGAPADDGSRCWSPTDHAWRSCATERSATPAPAIDVGSRAAPEPRHASTSMAGDSLTALRDGQAVLSPILADSSELCGALRTPVLPDQRFVRTDRGLAKIAELDAERKRCLTTSFADDLDDAVPVSPGLSYQLHTKLSGEPGTILVANYGALVNLVRNGVEVAERPIEEPWVPVPYEPGDVVQALSRHEALLLPFSFVGVEELDSGNAPHASIGATWRGSTSRVIGPPVRQPDSRTLDVSLRVECHSSEPASASVVWGFVRDGVEMPAEILSAGPSEVAPCDGSVLALRRRVALPPGALSRLLEPYARVVAPSRAEAGMIVVSASSFVPIEDGTADDGGPTFGDPVPAAPSPTPLLASPEPFRTGLVPPDAKALRWMQENLETTREVRLTPLGAERIAPLLGVISRPSLDASTIGESDDSTFEAVEELVGGSTLALDTPLPASVDNSLLSSFPEIRSQGGLGSCAAFASTYYLMTHEYCLVEGCDASGSEDGTKFSPKFTYNLINGGEDGGSWITTAFSVMLDHGAPTWEEFPYVGSRSDPLNYRGWMTDAASWTTALSRRMHEAGEVQNVDTNEGLTLLKQKLLNGHVLNIATYVNSWQYTTLSDDPSTSDDDDTAGQQVAEYVNGTNGAHAMTVVGYDDTVWIDLNGNETVDAGEKGALKIANSWGKWKEDGFVWFAYDALRAASAVAGVVDDPSRRQGFWYDEAYWMTARSDYQPIAVAEFTLQHAQRDQLRVYVGTSEVGGSTPTNPRYPSAIYWKGGPHALDGSSTVSDASFSFDLSDLVEGSTARRWFVVVDDWTSGDASAVQSVVVRDLGAQRQRAAAGLPTSVDDDTLYAYADLAIGSDVPQQITPGQDVSSWLEAHHRPRRECAAFSLDLPCGAGELDVTLRELSGDAELLVAPSWMGDPCRRGAVARCISSNAGTSDETCTMSIPDPGTWLIGVRNVATDASIDFTLSTSVVETSSPPPTESLHYDTSAASWCWTPAASCEMREPASRFALYATTLSAASFGSAPGFSDVYLARLQASPWCLSGSLVADPHAGQVTMLELVGENEHGESEVLP
jgi:C1A family cysteine protease